MQAQTLAEYLTRLLGRPVKESDTVRLSSAQRARLRGWLESADPGRARSGPPPAQFQVAELADQLGLEANPGTPVSSTVPPATSNGALQTPPTAALSVGIDLQVAAELVDEEAARDPKSNAELARIFSARELSYASAKGTVRDTLAGLFAAKEALRKADPALLTADLRSLEILPDENGAPCFPGYSISISHSGGFAVAVAAAVRTR